MKKAILIVFMLAVAVSPAVFAQAGPPPRQTYPAEVRGRDTGQRFESRHTVVVWAYDEENALRLARQQLRTKNSFTFLRWISTEEYERMDFGETTGNGIFAARSYLIRARYFINKRNYARSRADANIALQLDPYNQVGIELDAELKRLGY